MSKLKHICAVAICAAFVCCLQNGAFAQDDETPEQKKLMQTLEEREKVAQEERRDTDSYTSPEDELMEEKERDRAERERGMGGYWY